MGIYDEYGKQRIQLKVGPCLLKAYKRDEKVNIDDGVYIGYEGVVIINKGKLLATFSKEKLYDKYGSNIIIEEILNKNNHIFLSASEMVIKRREKEERFKKLEKIIKEDLEIAPIDIEGSRKEFNRLHKEVTEKLEKKENEE